MTTNTDKLSAHMALTDDDRTELLDWVSACQSQYHIDSTPGHRFGGLGSNLEENRLAVVDFVNGLLSARALAAIPAERAPAPTVAEAPVFTVDDADLDDLLNAAHWMHQPGAGMDNGIEFLDALERVKARLAAPTAQEASKPVQAEAASDMVLVPKRMTKAMSYAVEQEGWEWEDLLAAAEAITEDEYAMLASPPAQIKAPVQNARITELLAALSTPLPPVPGQEGEQP